MKLDTVIAQHRTREALGTTEAGRDWALKALHPASAGLTVRGIPDQCVQPVVAVDYHKTVAVTAPDDVGAGQSWKMDLYFVGHPVLWGCVVCVGDFEGAVPKWVPVYNEQIEEVGAGLTIDTRLQAGFAEFCERYRMTYGSITGHLDASSIANQGSLALAQYPLEPTALNRSFPPTTTTDMLSLPWETYPNPLRTYEDLITMPGTMQGEAKHGFYMPKKLTSFGWQSAWERRRFLGTYATAALGAGPFEVSGFITPTVSIDDLPFGILTSSVGNSTSGIHMPACSNWIGQVSCRNLDPAASFVLTYRMGFELQVAAGTPLTPFQAPSPDYDMMALEAYAAIVAKIDDGFPESFNSLGDLLKRIASVAMDVLPSLFPGAAPLVGAAKAAYKLIRGDSVPKEHGAPVVVRTAAPALQSSKKAQSPSVQTSTPHDNDTSKSVERRGGGGGGRPPARLSRRVAPKRP